MAITMIAILTIMLADMLETTSTAYAISAAERDRVQAEYMAKSGLNLTRMLVANEPQIRQSLAPIYQMMLGKAPPQLPVWKFANEILRPFCRGTPGPDEGGSPFGSAKGLDKLPARCEVKAFAENSKINVNDPLFFNNDAARRSIAMQLYALMGGYQTQSRYDPLFAERDAEGQFNSRLDIISAMIDWWDDDTTRTTFDPGAAAVGTSGSEDDPYGRYDDPYKVKNAPFDSIEELRLVRGVSDDFWSTFVEPSPDDFDARLITIYGSGAVNPNEAPPEVLLARLCSFVPEQPLCSDTLEASKFVQLVKTARSLIPLPFFSHPNEFLNFLEGKGGPRDLYPMLSSLLGGMAALTGGGAGGAGGAGGLLFKPVSLPPQQRAQIAEAFVTAASILTVHVTGIAGNSTVHITAVTNNHDKWTPPPPNPGTMPRLGVLHYYRID